MIAVGGAHAPAAFLAAEKTLLFHEAGHAVAAMALAGLAQLGAHARAAIGVTAFLANDLDLLTQDLILPGARAWLTPAFQPIVIAAFGNAHDLAEQRDGMLGFHRVDPLISLGRGGETMPRVFFRISRCSRK